jgi:peptidoglycan L-alanyl-D-glutamate endopeptidase CwlK
MTDHDTAKLVGCHPQLIAAVGKVLDAMAALGHQMLVTDGVRTLAQQQALYAQGRTTPGPIVTEDDGVTHPSRHQLRPSDELGHAADCCFLVNGAPSWDARLPWQAYGACAQALGLTWGGAWVSLKDLPHVELP